MEENFITICHKAKKIKDEVIICKSILSAWKNKEKNMKNIPF